MLCSFLRSLIKPSSFPLEISPVTRAEHIYFMLYIDVIGDQQSTGHTLPNTIFQKLALIEYSQSEKLCIFSPIRFGLSDGFVGQLNFLKPTKFVIYWLKTRPDCSKMNEVMVSRRYSVRFQWKIINVHAISRNLRIGP